MILLSEQLKHEIIKELIEYYDTIKFEIDIKSQRLLLINKQNDSDVLDLYMKLIERVEYIFDQNIKEINNYFGKNAKYINETCPSKEDIKSNAFTKYCTFIDGDCLKVDLRDKFKIGIFIECDWYLNKNQINYLKYEHCLYF
jgi:hypothetical protein